MSERENGAGPFNLDDTYAHVRLDERVTPLPVGDSFWDDVIEGRHPELEKGYLLSVHSFTEPWQSWERHPAGEELVLLLAGTAEFVLELPEGLRHCRLEKSGDYLLVPRDCWHRGLSGPARLLFLTAGRGTEHRPAGGD